MVRSQNLYISMYNGHSVNTCAALNITQEADTDNRPWYVHSHTVQQRELSTSPRGKQHR